MVPGRDADLLVRPARSCAAHTADRRRGNNARNRLAFCEREAADNGDRWAIGKILVRDKHFLCSPSKLMRCTVICLLN